MFTKSVQNVPGHFELCGIWALKIFVCLNFVFDCDERSSVDGEI